MLYKLKLVFIMSALFVHNNGELENFVHFKTNTIVETIKLWSILILSLYIIIIMLFY